MSSKKSRSEIDCFQFRPVPFAFCSSIFTTSTSDIGRRAAGAGADARPAALPAVVVFRLGRVGEGLRGIDPAVPDVPAATGCSSTFSLRNPSLSRILLNRLMGKSFHLFDILLGRMDEGYDDSPHLDE